MPKANKAIKGPSEERIPSGEILEDITKNKWRLGQPIGQGGFGVIYLAQRAEETGSSYDYVIKIEPHTNGPLFVERNLYLKFAKAELIEKHTAKLGLKQLGMPVYHGSGSHEYKNEKYRFLVIDRFGSDLHKIFTSNGSNGFPVPTVFKIATQIVEVLEFMHSHGYVHADIKSANLLLGRSKKTENQVFLVDFGVATTFSTDKKFKPDPKKAHNGTMEYLSTDAHKGVPTRRGDLEILLYNLIEWLGGSLPWKKEKNADKVHAAKTKYVSNIGEADQVFNTGKPPATFLWFLEYVTKLEHNEQPNYKLIVNKFKEEIERSGGKITDPFSFSSQQNGVAKPRSSLKRKSSRLSFVTVKRPKVAPKSKVGKKQTNKVQSSNVENEKPKKTKTKPVAKNETSDLDEDVTKGYTPAMKELLLKKQNKVKTKSKGAEKKPAANDLVPSTSTGFTDEMRERSEKLNKKKVKKVEIKSPEQSTKRDLRPQNNVDYVCKTPAALRKVLRRKL